MTTQSQHKRQLDFKTNCCPATNDRTTHNRSQSRSSTAVWRHTQLNHIYPFTHGFLAVAIHLPLLLSPGIAERCVVQACDSNVSMFVETVDRGLLFIDGELLERPYVIRVSLEEITANGVLFQPRVFFRDVPAGSQDPISALPPGEPFRVVPQRIASEIVESLRLDMIVVAFGNHPARILTSRTEQFFLLDALLAERPTQEQTKRFLSIAHGEALNDRWQEWLLEFEFGPKSRLWMQDRWAAIAATDANNQSQVVAYRRLNNAAYPLTLLGMVIGAIALGHLLQWSGKGLAQDEQSSRTPQSIRFTVRALLLIAAMSALDLIWTILSGSAGLMNELNPVASTLTDSPVVLIFFKVVATTIGVGILYLKRHRQVVQQTVWWICLITILLTFRWIVFNSLLI